MIDNDKMHSDRYIAVTFMSEMLTSWTPHSRFRIEAFWSVSGEKLRASAIRINASAKSFNAFGEEI